MKKLVTMVTLTMVISLFVLPQYGNSQDPDLFTEGSVWSMTFIKIHPNMSDDYLKGLNKTWKASMDGLVKEKLIKSYKILMGEASNPQDFDLVLLTEMENFAMMDPDMERDKKMDAVEKNVRDAMGEEFMKTVQNYTTMRDITGRKTMREIFLK